LLPGPVVAAHILTLWSSCSSKCFSGVTRFTPSRARRPRDRRGGQHELHTVDQERRNDWGRFHTPVARFNGVSR
jgi:hypothetical protein